MEHLGLDPGLRKGALVAASSEVISGVLHIQDWSVSHQWDDRSLGKKSTPGELATFVHDRLLSQIKGPVISAVIEWDPNSVYWRAQRLQVVVTSFMIGYFTRGVQTMGLPVHYLTPHQLKRLFDISPKEKKEYMNRPLRSPLMPITSSRELPTNPDEYDALLLAISPVMRQHDPLSFKTLLSSK